MTVNAFSSDRGWLFQDILHQLYDAGAVTSHEPISGFDSYLCIRSSEAALSPRLDRTVVQIHCQEPRWIGSAAALDKCAGFIFTHPAQAGILEGMGVKLDGKQTMCRPIGSKRAFTVRQSMPSRFTVGWVGRNSGAFKRINLYVEALELVNGIGVQADALLVGSQLADAADTLRRSGIEVTHYERTNNQPATAVPYVDLYHRMDALVITSQTEAGPLPLFEALACGVPVVSTDCGWAHRVADRVLPPDPRYFCQAFADYAHMRLQSFSWRHEIAATVDRWRMEDWIDDSLHFTRTVTDD